MTKARALAGLRAIELKCLAGGACQVTRNACARGYLAAKQ